MYEDEKQRDTASLRQVDNVAEKKGLNCYIAWTLMRKKEPFDPGHLSRQAKAA